MSFKTQANSHTPRRTRAHPRAQQHLTIANLTNADLTGANLTNAIVTDEQLLSARFNDPDDDAPDPE